MSRDRLSHGEMIAGISTILLSYFMCLDWFGSKYSGESGLFSVSVGRTAWEALDYIPIVLGAAIIAALAAPMPHKTNFIYKRSIPVNAIAGVLGIVSVLLILFRALDPPNFGSFRGGIDAGFPELSRSKERSNTRSSSPYWTPRVSASVAALQRGKNAPPPPVYVCVDLGTRCG